MTDIGHGETVAEPEGAAEAPEAPAAGGGHDRLLAAIEGARSDFTERIGALERRLPASEAPEPEAEEEPNYLPPDDFYSDEDFDEQGSLTQDAQMRAMQEMMRAIAREELSPLREERQQERRAAEADEIEQKYPRLQEPEFQAEIVQETVQAAEAFGNVEMAREPRFLEMVYLASEARRRAGDEVPAGSTQEVPLERGGSAGPVPTQQNPDAGDRIVSLAGRAKMRLG